MRPRSLKNLMKKILLATNQNNDATSWLRAWGPFTTPEMKKVALPIRPPENMRWVFDWTHFMDVDLVYLHRPFSKEHGMIFERAKQLGVPVWVDFDDYLEGIPKDNPVYPTFMSSDTQVVIDMCTREADILSCGGALHKKIIEEKYDRQVHLITNSVDDRLLPCKKPFKKSNKITWRGSQSHLIDLHEFEEDIGGIVEKFPKLDWMFFQTNPWPLRKHFTRESKWAPECNLFDYYWNFTNNNSCFHIVPLLEHIFNRVKSNIAWSDATLAGAVCLGPDFEEWQRPGIVNYAGHNIETGFLPRAIEMLQLSEKELKSRHDASWEYIRDNLLSSKINLQRIEILKNL